MKFGIAFIAMILMTFSPATAEEALMCLKETSKQEHKESIQTNLLSAIALVESGRFSKNYKTGIAWPWTVTAEGDGKFYKSKADAVKAVKELQQKGITNIDVGCMQINLKFHPEAFNSLDEALDPVKNVAYAADFLKRNYQETKSWGIAATRYHSKTTKKAFKYEDKLLETWKRLTLHGNPAAPFQKADVRDVSEKKVREINRKARIANRKNKADKSKQIQPGSEESKKMAAAWRKAKLEEYMSKKRAKHSDEPVFEDIRTNGLLKQKIAQN